MHTMHRKGSLPKGIAVPLAIGALFGMVGLLQIMGVIDIRGSLNNDFTNELNNKLNRMWNQPINTPTSANSQPNQNNPDNTLPSANQEYKCPANGIEAGCGSHPNGPNGPTVDGIPLPLKCECPPGTKFDRIVTWQGKEYRQCMCV